MDPAGSSGATGGGNTITPPVKRISPCIRWTFTLNNYTEEELSYIGSVVPQLCKYAIVGTEVGEKGTPHLQGYIEFKTKKRPLSVFKSTRFHWEKAKGTRGENKLYCSKEGKVVIHHPKPKEIKTISLNQMFDWQIDILEQIENEPDDRTIHWLWSKEGGVGKTSFLKYLVVHERFIVLEGKAADCKNGIVKYMEANHDETPERVGVNIPRSCDSAFISYQAFENIKDMLFYSGKYEGKQVCGNCPHLYIFANFSPDPKLLSQDRWVIKNIDGTKEHESEEEGSAWD